MLLLDMLVFQPSTGHVRVRVGDPDRVRVTDRDRVSEDFLSNQNLEIKTDRLN